MRNKFNRKKYSIMSFNRASSIGFVVLGCLLLLSPAQADELKDIHQLASKGQAAAALKRIDSYISAHPQDVQAQFMKGVILAEQGKRDDAIKIFSALTQKYPNLPEPYNNLAASLMPRPRQRSVSSCSISQLSPTFFMMSVLSVRKLVLPVR